MIRWNLEAMSRAMAARGIKTRRELGERAGLSLPTTYNITASGPLTRIDVPTLEALTRALGLDSPWDLLDYTPD